RILKDIEQRFGIDIIVHDSSLLLKDRYFVSFSHGETVKQMLFLLSYKREWAYTMKNDEQVIITKKS
ncbi:MAG: FecR domain-containing protein, partial [Tannerellaceae bacterium]